MKKYFFTCLCLNLLAYTLHAQSFVAFNSQSINGSYRIENGKAGVMSAKGKIYTPALYDEVSEIQDGIIRVELNGKTGFVDTLNKIVIPFEYEVDTLFFAGNRHLLTVVSFDKDGNEASKSLTYMHSKSEYNGFLYGLCAVVKNGKYGFIDKENNTVIPFIYEAADNFINDKYAIVMKNGKQGLINRRGQTVMPFIYDDIFWNENNIESDGELIVYLNGKSQYLKTPE